MPCLTRESEQLEPMARVATEDRVGQGINLEQENQTAQKTRPGLAWFCPGQRKTRPGQLAWFLAKVQARPFGLVF